MAHKVHPKIFRIGITENWDSNWFSSKGYRKNLKEDLSIRNFLEKKFEKGVIEKVKIERIGNKVNVIIRTARPGLLIGRGGEGVDILSKKIVDIVSMPFLINGKSKKFSAGAKKKSEKIKAKEINIDIEEIKNISSNAVIIAQHLALDVERRMPYRRSAKRAMERAMQEKEVQGIKIKIKGRLNGVEIARTETFRDGKLPLQTLRANIDYGEVRAYCNYGIVGIKVWLYKGEKVQ